MASARATAWACRCHPAAAGNQVAGPFSPAGERSGTPGARHDPPRQAEARSAAPGDAARGDARRRPAANLVWEVRMAERARLSQVTVHGNGLYYAERLEDALNLGGEAIDAATIGTARLVFSRDALL